MFYLLVYSLDDIAKLAVFFNFFGRWLRKV